MERWTRAFPIGPDNYAPFPGRDFRRALEGLSEDLRRGCSLLCLVGPAGSGKSRLLCSLRARLPRGFIGEIAQPPLGGLLSRLADGAGAASANEGEVLRRFREFRDAGRAEGLRIIQIIDDAETLSRADLALLRRLFPAVHGQVLLVGQPALLELFTGEEAAAVPDRVYCLEPLSADEVGAYIRHRLNEAGFDRGLFEPEAIAAIHAYSGGLPRLINLLCFTVLAGTAFQHQTPLAAAQVHQAARHRVDNGSYPFVRPPPASRGELAPSPENTAVVVDERRRRVREGSAVSGFGRTAWVLAAGVVLGAAAAHMPVSGLKVEGVTQRLGLALAAAGKTLSGWWPSSSVSPPAAPQVSAAPPGPVAAFEAAPAAPERAVMPPKPAVGTAARAIHAAPEPAVAAPPAGNDDEAARLSLAERRHLARLYAERAQYEMRSGRWIDARISILRGLRLVPDDPDLQGLDRGVKGVLGRVSAPADAAEQPEGPRQVPAGPGKDRITQLYLQRAEYERQNRRLQDALASINYGLKEDPDNGPLLNMRRQVMEELAVQQRHAETGGG
jgi:type II secretory pathway predicted ATPase ExeA